MLSLSKINFKINGVQENAVPDFVINILNITLI